MLRKVGESAWPISEKDAVVSIKDASYPIPFPQGLEFNSPAHGCWNIVHTGMLIPEAHQIYVCADNCMRGVVLTAAEMHAEVFLCDRGRTESAEWRPGRSDNRRDGRSYKKIKENAEGDSFVYSLYSSFYRM